MKQQNVSPCSNFKIIKFICYRRICWKPTGYRPNIPCHSYYCVDYYVEFLISLFYILLGRATECAYPNTVWYFSGEAHLAGTIAFWSSSSSILFLLINLFFLLIPAMIKFWTKLVVVKDWFPVAMPSFFLPYLVQPTHNTLPFIFSITYYFIFNYK